MIAKPDAPINGTKIEVTMRTQPAGPEPELSRPIPPKASAAAQTFDRTENAGTISKLPHHLAMATIKPQAARFS